MNNFENILVDIDPGPNVESLCGSLSPPNLEAVERAMVIAEKTNATLTFESVLNAQDLSWY